MQVGSTQNPDNLLFWLGHRWPAVIGAVLAAYVVTSILQGIISFISTSRALANVPTAPESSWFLGNAIALMANSPWEKMNEWVLAEPAGIVKVRALNTYMVIVGSPQGMKQVFQTKQRDYGKDVSLSYQHFLNILGAGPTSGLVTAEGEHWRRQRSLVGPTLRTDILDAIIGIGKRAADRLSQKLDAYKASGQVIDMEEEFRLLTLQVIGEAMLSLPPEECDKVFPELYLPVMTENNLRVLKPWRAYIPSLSQLQHKAKVRQLNSYIKCLLHRRWADRQRNGSSGANKQDVLERIMQALEDRGESLSPTVEEQLCFEIKTILLAGHETSAAMLTWTLLELTRNPDCLQKVLQEAGQVFGAAEHEPSRDAAESMEYIVACLKESLRRYSVVPVVVRELGRDDVLCGYKLPRGSHVVTALKAVHQQWKDPMRWQPERFLPGGEFDQFSEDIRQYMFVPFIQGPRNCLGQNFALLEARIVLALIVKRFMFQTADDDRIIGLQNEYMIPAPPLHGLKVFVK
ncbi:hypothetical protein ABBQ32_009299 [Trebouxia sp. C0010 RCD-2024]